MNKANKKKNTYNTFVIKELQKRYGVTRRFVTMSLKGDRVSLTSESIKKDYKTIVESIEKTVSEFQQ